MKLLSTSRRRAAAPRKRRAAFLVEVLSVMVVMIAVSVIATEMFVLALQVMRDTKDRDTLIGRVDNALDTLRRDAWAASSAKPSGGAVESGDSVEFHLPSGTVTWRMTGSTLTRIDPAGSRSWIELPAFHFAAGSRGVLSIEVDAGPAGTAKREHVSLASPLLAGGAQ